MLKQGVMLYYLWLLGVCCGFNYTTYMKISDNNLSQMIYEPELGSGWPLIKGLCTYIGVFYHIRCVYQNNTEASFIIENLLTRGGPNFLRHKFRVSKIMDSYNWSERNLATMQRIYLTNMRLWMEIDLTWELITKNISVYCETCYLLDILPVYNT